MVNVCAPDESRTQNVLGIMVLLYVQLVTFFTVVVCKVKSAGVLDSKSMNLTKIGLVCCNNLQY